MVLPRWFGDLRIRYKLFLTYSAVLLVTVGVGTLVLDSYVRQSIRRAVESDLTNAADLAINTVKTAAAVSVKNHLRATAENNREIVRYYYQQSVSGRLSQEEAQAAVGAVLLSQRVGKTGYLFVWDIRNAPQSIQLAVHPKIQGQEVAGVDFVQEGARLKNGYIEYRWRNPGEETEREKAMYLAYFEPWQWVIAVSSYKDEFRELVNVGDFRDNILSIRMGRTGYFFVIDSSGNIVIHPALEGNYFDAVDGHGRFFIREICSIKRGQLSYSWKNPGEESYRQKLASFGYIPEYDWIVASSGYKDEFEAPLQGTRSIALLTTGMSVLLILAMSFAVGFFINRPMQELVDVFEQDSKDLAIRLPVKSLDEIGRLTLHFNKFMDRLERESTERSAAEGALRESQERFQELAELLPETVFEMDAGGMITFVNRNAFGHFGFSQDDFDRGLNGFEMISPEDRPRALENARRVLDGEKLGLNEYIALRKGGNTFPVIMHSTAKYRDGKPVGIRGIVIDITETKKLEAQLRQAHKMEAVGTLAGGIAHDFNNLLQAIQGYAELLLLKKTEKGSGDKELLEISRAAKRGGELTRQLLTFSRKVESRLRPADLNRIVEDVRLLLERTIPKMIKIELHLTGNLHPVNADASQIEQILMNLAVNARDAMPVGGTLSIGTKNFVLDEDDHRSQPELSPGKYVRLTVTDSGQGMDKTTLENIFDPFFTTKEVGKGTGLGLAMVYGIVKNHHGHISCDSKPGEGTTFEIYLPALEHSEIATTIVIGTEVSLGGQETVLLVDDDDSLRTLGEQILEAHGYTVLSAPDGESALRLYQECRDRIDLVVLDLIMPGMGGAQCLQELLEINSAAKVVIASGYSANGETEKAAESGAKAFINKPYAVQQMLQVVREVLDG
jgi:PAS domain S-box-containing protein